MLEDCNWLEVLQALLSMHVALLRQSHDPAYQAFGCAADWWASSAAQPVSILSRVFSRSGQPGKCLHAFRPKQVGSCGSAIS